MYSADSGRLYHTRRREVIGCKLDLGGARFDAEAVPRRQYGTLGDEYPATARDYLIIRTSSHNVRYGPLLRWAQPEQQSVFVTTHEGSDGGAAVAR